MSRRAPELSETTSYSVVMTLDTGKRVITRVLGIYDTRSRAVTAARQNQERVDAEGRSDYTYSFAVAPLWISSDPAAFVRHRLIRKHPELEPWAETPSQ